MMDNQKMAEFISAEWEAKGKAFEIALQSPFVIPVIAPTTPVHHNAVAPDDAHYLLEFETWVEVN